MENKSKKLFTYSLGVAFVIIILYLLMGYINSYFGYFGYNKDKFRRYSDTIEESIDRNVFVKKLNFRGLNRVQINDVFIEKGYRWGISDKQTKSLLENDNLDNKSCLTYQIIIDFDEMQNKKLIYIPNNRMLIDKSELIDTLTFEMYVRDVNNKLIEVDTLKIWQDIKSGNG